ncbi:hypothetical protein PV783_23865 [Chitinophaga sp. CC14]|uniref:TolB family protein n=1 Tax=Chitinophaga sp. CC14 TaxID=3029199 RepID=UPI003B807E58
MKTRILLLPVLVAMMLFNACKKDDQQGPGGDNGSYNYGPGAIFIKQGTEGITKIDMSTGELSLVMKNWLDAGWDISWDGKKGVKQVDVSYDETKYIIFNTGDGSTLKEVSYEPADNHGGLPCISPDGTKLALRPTLREGLVILDMAGNVLKSIAGYGADHTFEYLDPINWAPDGSILFKKNSSLYRTSVDFSRAFKIKDIPFSDWKGDAVASPDGQKIAMSLNGHIWLMNADGSDLHQVTQSSQQEVAPSFSPDSRYIAMKANSRAGVPGSGTTAPHLCLIPADGQVYKVYPGEDNRVIHPTVKGASPDSRGLGVAIVGDFVWR